MATLKDIRMSWCIGGGAPLVADAIREQVNIRDDRFFVADDPQLALVHGLKAPVNA
uniref:hypothetical protein n=1 Tax=Salmonella sp. TaxID=599 RepID=UPI003995F48D